MVLIFLMNVLIIHYLQTPDSNESFGQQQRSAGQIPNQYPFSQSPHNFQVTYV